MQAILYAEIYLLCIVVIALLYYSMVQSKTLSTPERWFRRMLLAFLVSFFANFLFSLFNLLRIIPVAIPFTSYLFKTVYYVFLTLAVLCWVGYVEREQSTDFSEDKSFRRIMTVMTGIALLLILLNPFTRWVFEIDENSVYHRGVLYHALMVYLFLFAAIASVRLLKRTGGQSGTYSHNPQVNLIASFPLFILAAWILSFTGEDVPVVSVCVTTGILAIYLGSSNQRISTDQLTQVNNRQNLLSYIEYKVRNHDGDLYLLMMDIDYFKTINDTYGHLEGDAALVQTASCLKRACALYKKRPYIARYGGDEFIVVMEASAQEVSHICDSINRLMAEVSVDLPYDLHMSIGVCRWQEGMDHKQLIATADAALYEIKRGRMR